MDAKPYRNETWKCDCGKTKAPWFGQCSDCQQEKEQQARWARFVKEGE